MSRSFERHLRLVLPAALRLVTLASLGLAAAACDVPEADAEADGVQLEQSALTSGGMVYDYTTYEMYSNAAIHVCPPGKAMQGLYANANGGNGIFKCRNFTPVAGSVRRLDINTQGTVSPLKPLGWRGYSATTMHSCQVDEVMVGMSIGRNWLICQKAQIQGAFHSVLYRDDSTLDTETNTVNVMRPPVMHTCATTDDLMWGVHIGNNQLGCMQEAFASPH